jgi:hypothetical protein
MVTRHWIAAALLATGTIAAAPPKNLTELLAQSPASDWRALDPANTLYMQIPQGRVVIELAPQFAPACGDGLREASGCGYLCAADGVRGGIRRGTRSESRPRVARASSRPSCRLPGA